MGESQNDSNKDITNNNIINTSYRLIQVVRFITLNIDKMNNTEKIFFLAHLKSCDSLILVLSGDPIEFGALASYPLQSFMDTKKDRNIAWFEIRKWKIGQVPMDAILMVAWKSYVE